MNKNGNRYKLNKVILYSILNLNLKEIWETNINIGKNSNNKLFC